MSTTPPYVRMGPLPVLGSAFRQRFTSWQRRGTDGSYSASQEFPAGYTWARLQVALLAPPRGVSKRDHGLGVLLAVFLGIVGALLLAHYLAR
jgi:hypothetical protein